MLEHTCHGHYEKITFWAILAILGAILTNFGQFFSKISPKVDDHKIITKFYLAVSDAWNTRNKQGSLKFFHFWTKILTHCAKILGPKMAQISYYLDFYEILFWGY